MDAEDARCAEARKFERIDDAFRRGDLEALRMAVDDPAAVPNGRMPDTIGPCLVYAVYHSPLAFIRTLLEIGADPNAPVDDGFPPLIAALCCTRETPGANRRTDVDDVLRLLLSFGADPNGRGINDYTPLHMAVAERNLLAIHILLEAGADPDVRTRIDECETPLDMANAAGLTDAAAMLARRGRPLRQRLRSGLTLLADVPGLGDPVRRQHNYRIRLRLWLNKGEAVRWPTAMGPCRRRAARGQRRDADHGGPRRPALADQRALLRRWTACASAGRGGWKSPRIWRMAIAGCLGSSPPVPC